MILPPERVPRHDDWGSDRAADKKKDGQQTSHRDRPLPALPQLRRAWQRHPGAVEGGGSGAMPRGRDSGRRFPGFQSPNYTMVPDELFDELMVELSGAELKVLLYIIRRTFGFKKDSDNISLSQLLNGIETVLST